MVKSRLSWLALCQGPVLIAVMGMIPVIAAQGSSQGSVLSPYQPANRVSGVIRIWGSPQMQDLLDRYESGFRKLQPAVQFEASLKSTVTSVAGVYSGEADIGLLGREIWPSEELAFKSIAGRPPTLIEVATGSYDVPKATYALMIFVNRANPVASLSMAQLSRIFGDAADRPAIQSWGELGLKGAWANRPIHLYGYSTGNDKALIFWKMVFKANERWSCRLHEYSNSSGPAAADAGDLILRALAKDPGGIAISNIHYSNEDVKALPLSVRGHDAAIAPTRSNIAARKYPLTRAVYMVINLDPLHAPGPAVVEFLRYVLSAQGQHDVLEEGNYLPLTVAASRAQLRILSPH